MANLPGGSLSPQFLLPYISAELNVRMFLIPHVRYICASKISHLSLAVSGNVCVSQAVLSFKNCIITVLLRIPRYGFSYWFGGFP